MPRKVNPEERQAQYEDIKTAARDLMRELGTQGLSIRAIARKIEMTPPSIYYYFENLDALITELIVDAFNGLADAMEAAQAEHADAHPVDRLMKILLAYRKWAITHPYDFQLVYGNPIPGYEAPREVTVPAVTRGFILIVGAIQAVLDTGEVEIPEYMRKLPPIVEQAFMGIMSNPDELTADQLKSIEHTQMDAMNLGIRGWSQMHGLIMLDLFGHLEPVVGDTAIYFEHQLLTMFRSMGIQR